MAEEIRVQTPDPEGNGFLLDLTQKKLGLTGPNVALLLLIIIIGGVAWLRTGTIDKTLHAVAAQVASTEDRVQKRVDQLLTRIDKIIDDTQGQNTLLSANNTKITTGQHELRVHLDESMLKQNDLLRTQLDALEQYIEGWFTEVGTRLELLNYNIKNPDKALPLRAPLPREDHLPGRER